MDNVNIREYMDERFKDHRLHVDSHFNRVFAQLTDIELAARADRAHSHDFPTWPQIIGVISVVAGLMGGLVLVFIA